MSEMRSYCAIRFKFTKNFADMNEMYNFIRNILGEPKEICYKSNWTGEEFVKTDEVEYFEYSEEKGNYVIQHGDGWYLDYMLDDSRECYEDIDVSLDFNELIEIRNKTLEKFKGCISDECKLKVFEWYDGTDMPVNF